MLHRQLTCLPFAVPSSLPERILCPQTGCQVEEGRIQNDPCTAGLEAERLPTLLLLEEGTWEETAGGAGYVTLLCAAGRKARALGQKDWVFVPFPASVSSLVKYLSGL